MKRKSYLYISITVLLWGSTAAVAKLLLVNLNNFQLVLFISLFATITLFLISLFKNKINLIKQYTIRDYSFFAFMGFIGVFLYHQLLFIGFSLAPVQEAYIVNYTWPIWVTIFAIIFLKEKINFLKILAIGICFIGVYIVISKGNLLDLSLENIYGNLFPLIGAISYGLFSVIGKKDYREVLTSLMFYYLFSFVYSLLSVILFSSIPKVNFYELIGLVWLGAFAVGIAFVFWFLALKHGDTIEISNIVFLTPFISLVFIFILLGEMILYPSIIGLLMIVFGILLNNKNNYSL